MGIPSPHPPDPNIQVLFKNREASQIISLKKKKKPKLNLINNLDQGVLSQEPWRHLSRMQGGWPGPQSRPPTSPSSRATEKMGIRIA